MRELQRAHVEGRLPRRGESPDSDSPLTRQQYEAALCGARRGDMDFGGALL